VLQNKANKENKEKQPQMRTRGKEPADRRSVIGGFTNPSFCACSVVRVVYCSVRGISATHLVYVNTRFRTGAAAGHIIGTFQLPAYHSAPGGGLKCVLGVVVESMIIFIALSTIWVG